MRPFPLDGGRRGLGVVPATLAAEGDLSGPRGAVTPIPNPSSIEGEGS